MGGGAKWKHVIQEPLKRNLARQKKGTHIIIKSSQGKRETANIIPAPPSAPPLTHGLTHSSLYFPLGWQRRWEDWSCVCLVPMSDKMAFGNFLISKWFVCLHKKGDAVIPTQVGGAVFDCMTLWGGLFTVVQRIRWNLSHDALNNFSKWI